MRTALVSGRADLNRRPPAPHAGALAGLRHAPNDPGIIAQRLTVDKDKQPSRAHMDFPFRFYSAGAPNRATMRATCRVPATKSSIRKCSLGECICIPG